MKKNQGVFPKRFEGHVGELIDLISLKALETKNF